MNGNEQETSEKIKEFDKRNEIVANENHKGVDKKHNEALEKELYDSSFYLLENASCE